MTLAFIRERILTDLKTALETSPVVVAAAAVHWPNIRFQEPASGEWIRVTLQTGDTNPMALGDQENTRKRTTFVLLLQMFLPIETGTAKAYQALDKLSERMDFDQRVANNGTRKVTLRYRTWSIRESGEINGKQQFQLTLRGTADEDAYTAP